MEWNGERDALLRQSRLAGDSFGITLQKFLERGYRLTKNSLIGRATRLGLVRSRQPTQYLPRYHAPQKPKTNGHKVISSGGALTERLKRLRPAVARATHGSITPTDVAAGEFLGVALIDLDQNHCRYPHGDDPILFCGQAPLKGSPYCSKHHRICFYRGREP